MPQGKQIYGIILNLKKHLASYKKNLHKDIDELDDLNELYNDEELSWLTGDLYKIYRKLNEADKIIDQTKDELENYIINLASNMKKKRK